MALTVTVNDSRIEDVLIKETILNSAGINNITGASGTLHSLTVDSADGVNENHVKIYDATSATASTAPEILFPIPSNGTVDLTIVGGIAFTNGLCMRSTREAGTSGTTSPGGSNVTVYIVVS
jgi:hypothetical protein